MGGSGVQRWVKFAKYLPENGWQPVVYTPSNPDFHLTDESLVKDVPQECEVIKQKIWEPYKLASFLTNKKRTDLEVDNFRASKSQSRKDKVLNYIRSNYFIPDPRVGWVKKSIKFLTEYLKDNPVDAIVTNGPPHSMHLIGLGLKEKLGIRWIADFRDPWTKIDYYYTLNLTEKSDKKHKELEKEVVSMADVVTVAWDSMKADFQKYNPQVEIITNGYDQSDFSKPKPRLDKSFSICHTGLLNADRNPTKLWKVLKKIGAENPEFLKDLEIKLVGKLEPQIVHSIEEQGLSMRLNVIPHVPHNEVQAIQLSCQLLLLVVSDTPAAKGMIVGKLFEYLKADRPIIAICPSDGSLARIIDETKSGHCFDYNEEALLESQILKSYQAFKDGTLYIQSEGIEKYSRKNLTKDLVRLLEQHASPVV